MFDRAIGAENNQWSSTWDEIVTITSLQVLAGRIEKYPAKGTLDSLVFDDDKIVLA